MAADCTEAAPEQAREPIAPEASAFFDRLAPHLGAADLARVRSAWDFAERAHRGQFRASGEAYISHPLAVAQILFETVPDADALCAALLHDTVEDCAVSLETLKEHFGPTVAAIVDAVSKFDTAALAGTSLSAAEETLRKLLAAGGRDRRVFALKLADRLHNVRTLDALRPAKRERVARETLAIYCPLAAHVGLNGLGDELYVRSRRILYPWRQPILERRALGRAKVDAERILRVSALARQYPSRVSLGRRDGGEAEDFRLLAAYLREHARDRSFFGVPTLRIAFDSVQSAYAALAHLHLEATMVPGSFRVEVRDGWIGCRMFYTREALSADFILSFPPPRALGAITLSWDGGWIDEVAAAASVLAEPGAITRSLREIVDLRAIWTFSPAGRGFKLPVGASALDFAFAVHTDVGLRASAARVNGELRDLSVVLKTGDVVEILTASEIRAHPGWLPLLQSPRARAKLRHWLRERAHAQTVARGRTLLLERVAALDPTRTLDRAAWQRLAEWAHARTPEDALFAIGSGSASATLAAAYLTGVMPRAADLEWLRADESLVADGRTESGLLYCERCQPIPPDDIFAVPDEAGLMVHRSHCAVGLRAVARRRMLPIRWAAPLAKTLPSTIRLRANDRVGLLADCASTLASERVSIDAVQSRTVYIDTRGVAELDFVVRVRSRRAIERCLAALRRVPGVLEAERLEGDASA
ncbi:MAG: HD domain-containing protein [Casimicrobiaceae bacterium]|nr:HD domain-containing protein [Casimicrobiaceae bacterium]